MKNRFLACALSLLLCFSAYGIPASAITLSLDARPPATDFLEQPHPDADGIVHIIGDDSVTRFDGQPMHGDTQPMPDVDEVVTVIVQLAGKPLGSDAAFFQTSGNASSKIDASNRVATNAAKLRENQARVAAGAKAFSVSGKILYTYDTVFNGMALEVRYRDVDALRALAGVESVYLCESYDAPIMLDDTYSTAMANARAAWATGYNGDGMLIAVVDSGIDYNHPMLSALDSSMEITAEEMARRVLAAGQLNAKVAGGRYVMNDKVIFGYDYANRDDDPMDDRDGHGTHVAGIAAGGSTPEGVELGMAPNAQLMALKVFTSENSSTTDATILAAVDDAVKLGADVINLSLGSPAGFSQYPGVERFTFSTVYENARASGCMISGSAGNEGHIGAKALLDVGLPYASNPDYGLVGTPGIEPSSMSTASVENTMAFQSYFTSGDTKIPYDDHNKTPISQSLNGKTLSFVAVPGYGLEEDYAAIDAAGKIALVSRGNGSFSTKALNAEKAGAVAIVVYNNADTGFVNMDLTGAAIPGIFIEQAAGLALAGVGAGSMTFSTSYIDFFPNFNGGGMSDFSSWGVTPDLKIKPDLSAAGGNIFSAVPDGYASMSGTSMAAPQTAGASVLVRQRVEKDFPSLTPAQQTQMVENLLMSAARPVDNTTDEYTYNPYPVQQQGAGMIDAYGAVKTPVVLYNNYDHKTKVELGDKLDCGGFTVSFTAENLSATDQTFALDSIMLTDAYDYSANANDPTDIKYFCSMASVPMGAAKSVSVSGDGEYGETLTIRAGGKVAVTATFAFSDDENERLLSVFTNGYYAYGYVTLNPVSPDERYALSIPFLGFIGDWTQAPHYDDITVYDNLPEKLENAPFYFENVAISGYNYNWLPLGVKGSSDYNAISPRTSPLFNDAVSLSVATLRNIKSARAEVLDEHGAKIRDISSNTKYYTKAYNSTFGLSLTDFAMAGLSWDGKDNNGAYVPDGRYTYAIYTTLDYPGAETHEQSLSVRVLVDSVMPQVELSFGEQDGRTYMTVHASDNHYLNWMYVRELKDSQKTVCMFEFTGVSDFTSQQIDVTDLLVKYKTLDGLKANLYIYCADFAQNRLMVPSTPQVYSTSVSPYRVKGGQTLEFSLNIKGSSLEGQKLELQAYCEDIDEYLTPKIEVFEGNNTFSLTLPVVPPDYVWEEYYVFCYVYLNGKQVGGPLIFVEPVIASITSVSVTTPTIVESLAANLIISVEGTDLDKANLTASLVVNGKPQFTVPVVNGTAKMTIDQAPTAGKYFLSVKDSIGKNSNSCQIEVVPYDLSIWNTSLFADDNGYVNMRFNAAIGTLKGYSGSVNGVACTVKKVDDVTLRFNVHSDKLRPGDILKVSGVKYPLLFPSYSFTFSAKWPG